MQPPSKTNHKATTSSNPVLHRQFQFCTANVVHFFILTSRPIRRFFHYEYGNFHIHSVNPDTLTKKFKNQIKRKSCRNTSTGFSLWRRVRDSNPRNGVSVYTISNRAPSAISDNSPYDRTFKKVLNFQYLYIISHCFTNCKTFFKKRHKNVPKLRRE